MTSIKLSRCRNYRRVSTIWDNNYAATGTALKENGETPASLFAISLAARVTKSLALKFALDGSKGRQRDPLIAISKT